MINKGRLEAFSDGVFAIVMTLLVFDIKLPEYSAHISNYELWQQIVTLWPLIGSFIFSFLVLAVFWINHNFFFSQYIKEVDRTLNFLNMIFMLFLVFIPFSSHVFGTYQYQSVAALLYGLNILAVMLTLFAMLLHVKHRPHLAKPVETRLGKQAGFRTRLTIYSYIIGILCSFIYTPASVFFYVFPIIFNFLPGTLKVTERLFRLNFE